MKKIYVLLLLTAHITSTSCMEKQHKQPQKQTLFTYSPYLYSTSFPPTIIAEQPNYICTANQPGWEQLNDIANRAYKNELPVTQHSTNLTPVYIPIVQATNTAPTKQAVTKKEEKPLLRTITPNQPNNNLMQKLYNDAYNFMDNATFLTKTQKHRDKQFCTLICAINKERVNGINEDSMGKFAYDNQSLFKHAVVNQYTILFFNILKRYTLTVSQTKEALPFDVEKASSHKNLDHIFNLSPHTENQNTVAPSDTSSYCQQYSALNQLYYAIRSLDQYKHKTKNMYVSCLHANNILFEDCSQGSYTNLKDELFTDIYNMWTSDKVGTTKLYNLLQIIETAKNKQEILNESDLGYAFLDFEPTGFLYYFGVDLICMKKRTALFCKLVKQYNQERYGKTTPTDKQYSVYKMHSDLGLVFPDSFDISVFDKNIYAFAEFEQLLKNTKVMMKADNHAVQQHCDKFYPITIIK